MQSKTSATEERRSAIQNGLVTADRVLDNVEKKCTEGEEKSESS